MKEQFEPYIFDISSPEIYHDYPEDKSYRKWHPQISNFELRGINLNIVVSFKGDKENTRNDFSIFLVSKDTFIKNDLDYYIPTWMVKGTFDWEIIEKAINEFIDSSKCHNHDDCLNKIRSRMWWEFDDYDEMDESDIVSFDKIDRKQLTIIDNGIIQGDR